jgi:hypothetical protein
MVTTAHVDSTQAAELAALVADSAQLMLAAKKLCSTLTYQGARDSGMPAQRLLEIVCQAGCLMDEYARRVGKTPVYASADGWTLPLHIIDHD